MSTLSLLMHRRSCSLLNVMLALMSLCSVLSTLHVGQATTKQGCPELKSSQCSSHFLWLVSQVVFDDEQIFERGLHARVHHLFVTLDVVVLCRVDEGILAIFCFELLQIRNHIAVTIDVEVFLSLQVESL